MFAKLANSRRLEEATSAKDDVAPSEQLIQLVVLHNGLVAHASVADVAVRLQYTCLTRSLKWQVEEVKLLKA